MIIKKKIFDFLNSEDNKIEYNFEYKGNIILTKKEMDNKNLVLIYETSKSNFNDFSPYVSVPLFLYNKKNKNILYITNNVDSLNKKEIFEDNDLLNNEINEKKIIFNKIKNEIINKYNQKMSSMDETFLKEANFDEYKKYCLDKYLYNEGETSIYFDIFNSLNFEILNKYFTDKEKFLDEQSELLKTETNNKNYKHNLIINHYYNKLLDYLENDNFGKIKKQFMDIADNKKYKNINVEVKHPNGTIEKLKIDTRDIYKHSILENSILYHLPIKAIEKITWGHKVLYEKNEETFKKINYTEEEHINDFIKMNLINNLPEYVYKDKNYFFKHFKKNGFSGFELFNNDNTFKNKDFVNEFINEYPNNIDTLISLCKNNEIFKDKDFILSIFKNEKVLTNLNTNYELKKIVNILEPEIVNDLELAKLLFKTNCKKDYRFIKLFDKKIIKDKNILNIIEEKGIECSISETAQCISLFDDPKILLKLFDINKLRENISFLDESLLLHDKAFLLTLLDDITQSQCKNIFKNPHNNFLKYYANDNDIIDKVKKKICGKSNILEFLDIIGINPKSSKNKIYELASENVSFLNVLENDDISVYFEDEAFEIEDFIDCDCKSLELKSPFGYFYVSLNVPYLHQLIYTDNNNNEFLISNSDMKKSISKIILEKLNEKFPENKCNNLSEFINKNNELLSNAINKNKNIDNDDIER